MSLATRDPRDEQMDDPALSPEVYDEVLNGLGRLNRWTMTARPTLGFLRRATRGQTSFRLLDVGFGEGAMLRSISKWARSKGLRAELVGVDLNPKSKGVAEALTPADAGIEYLTGDYRDVPGPFDFVVSSLVTHHMTEPQLDAFVRFMEATARRGWFVNDLHRHAFAYRGFPWLARMLRVHRIVREDGTLSIARSFRPAEWQAILARAGVSEARVFRQFPFRLCVERLR